MSQVLGNQSIINFPQPSGPVVGTNVTQASIGALLYPLTTAELAAGVTSVNYQYPAGDLRRYGADPLGVAASDTALTNACLCNTDVFDGYPGGGSYLFNTGVTLTTFPLTIRGQAKNNKDVTTNVGTLFTLTAAAGNAASVINAAYIDGLNIRGIGFQFSAAAGTLSQYGIHVKTISATAGQMRSSIIENCAFIGQGAGDTNIGIQIDSGTGGAQYSAFNVIRSNYFSAINAGINWTGNGTPNFIENNSFLGYSGAASAKAGYGVYIATPAAEIKIIGNYFEGWTTGVFANQATNVQQIGNDYQVCTQGFNWVATGGGLINNQSIGETGVAGIYSGQATLDGSQIQMVGRLGWLATGGAIQSTRGFQEGTGAGSNLRTALLGYHTSPGAPTMTANAGGTIGSQTTTTWSYSQVGGELKVLFNMSATLTGGSTTVLSVPLPASLTSIVACENPCSITNNSGTVVGLASTAASGSALNFTLIAGGAFTAGTIGASGQISVRILS
jgi:hypothetical protein